MTPPHRMETPPATVPKPRLFLRDIIPATARWQAVDGSAFTRLRTASKAETLHPLVLEMGAEMLKSIGGRGVAYPLALQTDKLHEATIIKQFRGQLRKYAKAMEPGKKLKTHVVKDPTAARIVCWYSRVEEP